LFYNSTSNKCMTCKYFSYIMAVSFIGGFQYRCLSFCTFSFGHCVVCSSIYGFWLHLLYLQTLLVWKRGRPQQLKSVPTFILCQWSLLYKIRMVGHPELKLSHENKFCPLQMDDGHITDGRQTHNVICPQKCCGHTKTNALSVG
jgi:hypothetical protein